jgi:aminopeptidase N
VSVSINGHQLAPGQYHQDPKALTIPTSMLPPAAGQPGAQFQLAARVLLCPRSNTHLEGLFMTGGLLVTDNEPEGFRGITYFIDRPDVAARYTVRLEADKAACPVLLSNGKCTESGDLPNGWHFATWVDPVPKPSYLFCMVAGQLTSLEGRHVTRSGRTIQLRVWAAKEEIEAHRADWALACLQAAMR